MSVQLVIDTLKSPKCPNPSNPFVTTFVPDWHDVVWKSFIRFFQSLTSLVYTHENVYLSIFVATRLRICDRTWWLCRQLNLTLILFYSSSLSVCPSESFARRVRRPSATSRRFCSRSFRRFFNRWSLYRFAFTFKLRANLCSTTTFGTQIS